MTYSGRQGEETAVAWVLALSPRWAVSDCRHHGDSFEELAKPTAFFLCRMMKMLIPRQLKANAEGFYSENMLRAQCYSWSLATPKLVNIPDTLEKFSRTCLIWTDLFCYYFGFLLPGTQGIWHSPKMRRRKPSWVIIRNAHSLICLTSWLEDEILSHESQWLPSCVEVKVHFPTMAAFIPTMDWRGATPLWFWDGDKKHLDAC